MAVVSCGDAEWKVAATAYQKFGRGRHKAGLNFGDCLAYATAAVAGDTLLFVGDALALTDIRAA